MNQIPLFKFGQARIPLNSDTGMSISGSKKYDFLSVFATKNSPQINQYSGIPMIDVFFGKKMSKFQKSQKSSSFKSHKLSNLQHCALVWDTHMGLYHLHNNKPNTQSTSGRKKGVCVCKDTVQWRKNCYVIFLDYTVGQENYYTQ